MIEKFEKEVPSTDGIHTLRGVVFVPEGEILGLLHVVHGMTEYMGRYEAFLRAAAEAGYLAFGYDNLGHGNTARDASELGFIAERDGWKYLVSDVGAFARAVQEEYGTHLPYYLMGHSMGSFIVRCAALGTVAPKKLILMATGRGDPAAFLGVGLAEVLGAVYGKKHISHLMQALVFSDYDKRFPGDYPNRWVTVDTENLVRYKDDPFCTFRFTVSALGDLIRLNEKANSPAFYGKISPDVPILILSGELDPVGGYGKGVGRVYRKLIKKGKKATLKLYPGFRHEILQDFCREEVTADILSFLSEK